MLERTIVRDIRNAIVRRGGKVYKLHGSAYMQAGSPDLIGSLDGQPFALEVKQPGRQATPMQARELEEWRAQGWLTGVVCSREEAIRVLGGVRIAEEGKH